MCYCHTRKASGTLLSVCNKEVGFLRLKLLVLLYLDIWVLFFKLKINVRFSLSFWCIVK